MAKKETFAQFAKNFSTFDNQIDKLVLGDWNRATNISRGEAIERAPVASGNLAGSSDRLEAKITSSGIKSAIIFKTIYADKLNKKNSGIKLKNPGELSYHLKKTGSEPATKVFKQKKGELGFLDNAVDSKEHLFIRAIDKAIDKAWARI